MAQDKLDQLKQKYQSVFNAVQQQQVRLSHVNMQGDKLFVQGEAPSQEAKNKIWDQIKMVDSSYSDLVCDISVNPSLAPQPQSAPSNAGAAATGAGGMGNVGGGMQTYTVQAGDSLSKISQHFYGSANDYMKIFEANRDQLSDPNKIRAGQQLKIPAK